VTAGTTYRLRGIISKLLLWEDVVSERYDREEESRRLKERRKASPRADPGGRQRAATESSASQRVDEVREEREAKREA
jgi:hypothetical protein